jgi:hypothetical protein
LVPVAARWLPDDGDSWRLIPFLVVVLLMLRIVPAIIRRVVPFPQEVVAEWLRQRLLAKRFDSYQWGKLSWFGLGIGAYLVSDGRELVVPRSLALYCMIAGGLAMLRWRFLVHSGRVSGVKPCRRQKAR